MPLPKITSDEEFPPSEELTALGNSLFNLFPEWDFRLHGELDSTNSEARRIANTIGGAAWPRVILADLQTKGRGRGARTWEAPKGSSLMASIMFPKTRGPQPLSMLPLFVGCWARDGLEQAGAPDVALKWPNDLIAQGGKIGGVLCEIVGDSAIIGIGVNLTQSDDELPERGANEPRAVSIASISPHNPDRVISSISIMSSLLFGVSNPPKSSHILGEYERHCITFGQSVAYEDSQKRVVAGIARKLDASGGLVVEGEDGDMRIVTTMVDLGG